MPRLHSALRAFLPCTFARVHVLFIASAVFALPAMVEAAPPTPVITASATQGQAPFTVHVHALSSALNVGDETSARYEWTFGDAAGRFNALVGWNAAHTYNQPGTYTITLKVLNANREQAVGSVQVIVAAPTRTAIYVSPTGNDANAGSSSSSPVRSLSRVDQLVSTSDNRAVYFQRGGVWDTSSGFYIGGRNVLVSTYGTGAEPRLNFTSATSYTRLVTVGATARDVVIEGMHFDSPFAPDAEIVRAIETHGTNVTVRNCRFGNVSYAMNTGGAGVNGLLTTDNIAGVLGAYYVWAEGADHVHLGNTVAGSVVEHNIRLGNARRVLIAHNNLTNTHKSTVWAMLGDHCYVAHNRLTSGEVIAGPNFAVGDPSERFPYFVAEANEFFGTGLIFHDGAENLFIRGNVFHNSGGSVISMLGYSPERNRTVRNLTVACNTAVNLSSDYGKFLNMPAGVQNVMVAGNMYVAPSLNGYNGGNIVCGDTSLVSMTSHHNIWAQPKVGPRCHGLGLATLSAAQWALLPQVSSETTRAFGSNDLDASFLPTFNASVSVPIAGVFTDFYDNPRSATGSWLAGAVQAPGSIGNGPDITGDGSVDVDDLIAVVTGWGACNCPADTNGDGQVNVDDLIGVIVNWN